MTEAGKLAKIPGDMERFNMLRYIGNISRVAVRGKNRLYADWLCDCGCVTRQNISKVRRGNNKSCGCLKNAPPELVKSLQTREQAEFIEAGAPVLASQMRGRIVRERHNYEAMPRRDRGVSIGSSLDFI